MSAERYSYLLFNGSRDCHPVPTINFLPNVRTRASSLLPWPRLILPMQKGLPDRAHIDLKCPLPSLTQNGLYGKDRELQILWCFHYSSQKGRHSPENLTPSSILVLTCLEEDEGKINLSSPMASLRCGWWTDMIGDDGNLDTLNAMLVTYSCHTATTPQLLFWHIDTLLFCLWNLFCGWLLRLDTKVSASSGQTYLRFW